MDTNLGCPKFVQGQLLFLNYDFMKKLKNLNGVDTLSKTQQKTIFGRNFDTPLPEGGGDCPQSTCSSDSDCRNLPGNVTHCKEYHCGSTKFFKKCV